MVDVDPTWINASGGVPAYAASELRRTEAVLMFGGVADRLGARQGVRPGADAVSLAGTTVTVHNVPAVVYPAVTSISGAYRVALLETTHELNPADGTNPRKDLIVCQVQDHDEDTSGERRARSVYVPGTPGATPVEPELPAGSFRMATVTVPQSGGGGATIVVNAPYVVASGGVLPVRTAAELPTEGLYEGMVAFQHDLDQLLVWDGTAWQPAGSTKTPVERRYTSSTSWTKPAGLKYIDVELCGGGGGGGAADTTNSGTTSGSGGGGAGGYCRKRILAAALASSETVTVGAGGAAGVGGAGGSGGTTSFGAHCSATGGFGGVHTAGTTASPAVLPGGEGGMGSSGDINSAGGPGGKFVGSSVTATGGEGGSGPLGGGGRAGHGLGDGATAGRGYGAGGGGAANKSSTSSKSGGAGSGGIVIVTEYFG